MYQKSMSQSLSFKSMQEKVVYTVGSARRESDNYIIIFFLISFEHVYFH